MNVHLRLVVFRLLDSVIVVGLGPEGVEAVLQTVHERLDRNRH